MTKSVIYLLNNLYKHIPDFYNIINNNYHDDTMTRLSSSSTDIVSINNKFFVVDSWTVSKRTGCLDDFGSLTKLDNYNCFILRGVYVSNTRPINCFAAKNATSVMSNIPPGVPPVMSTPYIMGQVPFFQQPVYSYEDMQLLQQRLPHMVSVFFHIKILFVGEYCLECFVFVTDCWLSCVNNIINFF